MTTSEQPEELTPAERRLEEHLAVLRNAPEVPASIAAHVLRRARWQQAVRTPALAVAQLAAATLDAVRLLLGGAHR